jgi:hypothetical protein
VEWGKGIPRRGKRIGDETFESVRVKSVSVKVHDGIPTP